MHALFICVRHVQRPRRRRRLSCVCPCACRLAVLYVMCGVFAVFMLSQLGLHFRIVRASVAAKARPVEGPHAAGALRRAASRANLQAMMPATAEEVARAKSELHAAGQGNTPAPAPAPVPHRSHALRPTRPGSALRRRSPSPPGARAGPVVVNSGRHVYFDAKDAEWGGAL
jgi:hypothetical protein